MAQPALKRKAESKQPLAPRTAIGAQAHSDVVSIGLHAPRAPTPAAREAELPEDLTALSSQELGYQMTVWTNLLNFADYQKTLVKNDVDILEARLNRSVDRGIASGKGLTVTDRRARAKSDPQLDDLRQQIEHGKAAHNLLAAYSEMYLRNYQTVSREISRRIGTPDE
jgi:hypothetical protein